ncbi:MAG: FTR1 family protein [Thermomicrobium sp.]|nr:FTR1 family protein [Thermomicrobium sp.]
MDSPVVRRLLRDILLVTAIAAVLGILVWQGARFGGSPDPERAAGAWSAALSASVLVFREGLEAILVLAALFASLRRTSERLPRAIAFGGFLALLATVATWFIVVWIIGLGETVFSELQVQAATGLLAVIVLLVVMNWFLHRFYWTGWIRAHTRREADLAKQLQRGLLTPQRAFLGLAFLGFSAVYREGFETVLFLQDTRLHWGMSVIEVGAGLGLLLTVIVGWLTLLAHRRLPYQRMLVLTGAMLGLVFVVMVGEQAQEMQLAGWIPTTTIGLSFPDWIGTWFAVFPTAETLLAQGLAVALVLGSFLVSKLRTTRALSALPS